LITSSGVTTYIKGLKKPGKRKLALTICTKDLRRKVEKAIRSCSFSTTTNKLRTVDLHTAGD
jgi:hypothetical protein